MFTPLVLILIFLSTTFLLGLILGWLLWKFGDADQSESESTETEYWKERSEQARLELRVEQDKFAELKQECDTLMQRLKSA